jgi:hypothetical protein
VVSYLPTSGGRLPTSYRAREGEVGRFADGPMVSVHITRVHLSHHPPRTPEQADGHGAGRRRDAGRDDPAGADSRPTQPAACPLPERRLAIRRDDGQHVSILAVATPSIILAIATPSIRLAHHRTDWNALPKGLGTDWLRPASRISCLSPGLGGPRPERNEFLGRPEPISRKPNDVALGRFLVRVLGRMPILGFHAVCRPSLPPGRH